MIVNKSNVTFLMFIILVMVGHCRYLSRPQEKKNLATPLTDLQHIAAIF